MMDCTLLSSMASGELVGLIYERYYDMLLERLRGAASDEVNEAVMAALREIYERARAGMDTLDELDIYAAEVIFEAVQCRRAQSVRAEDGWEALLRRVESAVSETPRPAANTVSTPFAAPKASAEPEFSSVPEASAAPPEEELCPDDDIFSARPELPSDNGNRFADSLDFGGHTQTPPKPHASEPPSEAFGTAWLYDPPEPHPAEAEKGSGVLRTVFFVLMLLLLLWVVAGALMAVGVLPVADIGYSWFNRHIFRLF